MAPSAHASNGEQVCGYDCQCTRAAEFHLPDTHHWYTSTCFTTGTSTNLYAVCARGTSTCFPRLTTLARLAHANNCEQVYGYDCQCTRPAELHALREEEHQRSLALPGRWKSPPNAIAATYYVYGNIFIVRGYLTQAAIYFNFPFYSKAMRFWPYWTGKIRGLCWFSNGLGRERYCGPEGSH